MSREITIWTSEPDYEEYRQVMEEDLPWASECERREILRQANKASLDVQREEMNVDLGGPILVVSEESGTERTALTGRIIPGGRLSDCFKVPDDPYGQTYLRWFVDENGDLRSEEIDAGCGYIKRSLYRVIRTDVGREDRVRLEALGEAGCGPELLSARVADLTLQLGEAVDSVYGIDLD